jgi:hypothetical protein
MVRPNSENWLRKIEKLDELPKPVVKYCEREPVKVPDKKPPT